MQALMLSMMAVLEEDDNIVVIAPIWPNAEATVPLAGGESRVVNLRSGNAGWTLDLDELFNACDARTRGIFVNSPANPTGWTIGREQQQAILDYARANGLWVIADEIYARIVYDRPVAPSFLDICEPEDPVIVINSFSKSWAMTGWRLGWLTTPPSLGDFLENLIEYSSSGAATFVQHAGVTAIEEGEPFVASMVERCRTGREIVERHLAGLPRVRYQSPEAAFYTFFSVEGMDDSLEFAKELVRSAKVSVAPGMAFGPAGEGWLRVCFASAAESLEVAMERLANALS
jgi:aspartate/methionine/tyrosine aminotransferase